MKTNNPILTKREIILLIFCVLVGIISSTAPYELRTALEYPVLCISLPLVIWAIKDPQRLLKGK